MDMNTEMHKSPDYKRCAILFVDDEEKSLKYFTKIFSSDFRIVTATDVESAMSIIERRSDEIAVLITDQRMPKRKGIDLLKYTREKHPHIVRLLTTAYTDLGDAIEAVNAGEIFRYITKPWDISRLNDHLVDAMNLYLAREQERNLLAGKRQAMFQLAGNIAHELRTPLLSIHAAAKGAGNYLPQLITAYQKSLEHRVSDAEPIREPHLTALRDALRDIATEASHTMTIIDMLLMNIKGPDLEMESWATLSMRDCITEALQRFPFRENQKEIIELANGGDFNFRGARQLMVHVYFNLLKNALHAIATQGNRGSIVISVKPGQAENLVYFKDTGPGIAAADLPHIFRSFYSARGSWSEGSIGIGLSFCKDVMHKFNANIKCQSEEGVYTEFILNFPPVAGMDSAGRSGNIPDEQR
jgi:signal transduction histidine kinase